jgi:hypothetical protein
MMARTGKNRSTPGLMLMALHDKLAKRRDPEPEGDGKMYEIVRVVEPGFLINEARLPCRYKTADAQPLTPGYYLALWRIKKAGNSPFTDEVSYRGPLATRHEAEILRDQAAGAGTA